MEKKFTPVVTANEFETTEPVLTKTYIYEYPDVKYFYDCLIQAADSMRFNAKMEMCGEKIADGKMKITINLAMKKGHRTIEEIGGAESLLDYRMKRWEVA